MGAIVGALAQDITTLLIGRGIQGVGGGGIMSLTEILNHGPRSSARAWEVVRIPELDLGRWVGHRSFDRRGLRPGHHLALDLMDQSALLRAGVPEAPLLPTTKPPSGGPLQTNSGASTGSAPSS